MTEYAFRSTIHFHTGVPVTGLLVYHDNDAIAVIHTYDTRTQEWQELMVPTSAIRYIHNHTPASDLPTTDNIMEVILTR